MKKELSKNGWQKETISFYYSNDIEIAKKLINLNKKEQKQYLHQKHIPRYNFKTTIEFIKSKIAVGIQFSKYAYVAYDLFVKHISFYSGGVINLGIEILPTKKMQSQMSSGVAYFEGEVYNIMRHGRNNPSIPLLILGIEP